jgi:hypothetical protein
MFLSGNTGWASNWQQFYYLGSGPLPVHYGQRGCRVVQNCGRVVAEHAELLQSPLARVTLHALLTGPAALAPTPCVVDQIKAL